MRLQLKREDGMTLVELLAAITILSIVFLGVMYLLPQMTTSNLHTEVKLETMNLARAELNDLKELGKAGLESRVLTLEEEEIVSAEGESEIITRYSYQDSSDYNYKVDYYQTEDVSKNEHEKSIQLNKIHIKVYDGEKKISETFGYLEEWSN